MDSRVTPPSRSCPLYHTGSQDSIDFIRFNWKTQCNPIVNTSLSLSPARTTTCHLIFPGTKGAFVTEKVPSLCVETGAFIQLNASHNFACFLHQADCSARYMYIFMRIRKIICGRPNLPPPCCHIANADSSGRHGKLDDRCGREQSASSSAFQEITCTCVNIRSQCSFFR